MDSTTTTMLSLAIYCLITLSFGTVLEYSVTEPAFQSFSSPFASSSVLPVASGGVFAFAAPLACDEVAVCEPEVIAVGVCLSEDFSSSAPSAAFCFSLKALL